MEKPVNKRRHASALGVDRSEGNWTGVANDLLQVVAAYPFSAAEMKILFKVIRDTFGYRCTESSFSFGEIAQATGLHRRSVIRTVQDLIVKKVLFSRKTAVRTANVFGINTKYVEWARAAELNLSYFAARKRGDGLRSSSHGSAANDPSLDDSVNGATIKNGAVVSGRSLGIVARGSLGIVTQPSLSSDTQDTSYISKEKKENKQSRNKGRLESNSEQKNKSRRFALVAELLDGFEECIKGADPRPLVEHLREAGGFEVKRCWALLAQSRHAQNPAGFLVRTLADPRYQVADSAWAQAEIEMRRFNFF